MFYYFTAPSSPEGARRCPNRGNAGGALVFLGKFYTVHSVPTVNFVTTVTTLARSTSYYISMHNWEPSVVTGIKANIRRLRLVIWSQTIKTTYHF